LRKILFCNSSIASSFVHIPFFFFVFVLLRCCFSNSVWDPDSYWALDGDGDDGLWMEVYDEATHYKYYLHSVTGETQWAAEEASAGLTVWEELMDPITGEHYYYSNVG
jgi:hypothetical protein